MGEGASVKVGSLRSPFFLSLLIAFFTSALIGVTVPIILIEVASTYNITVGTASQISVVSSAVGIVFALLLGVLSARFRHKLLLIAGIFFISLSAIGCYLAPTFEAMQLLFALSGIGGVIITTITYTLIGDFLAIEQRSKAIGLMSSSVSAAYIIGSPIASYIITYAGWRATFLWSILPMSVIGILLALLAVPSRLKQPPLQQNSLSCFREVVLNKSAVACLVGSMLSTAAAAFGVYVVAFYNNRFDMPISFGAAIMMVGAVVSVIGGILAGRLINWRGRKSSIVIAGSLTTIFGIAFVFVPSLTFSVVLRFLCAFFSTMTMTAFASLSVEQTPQFRGTMMSLISAVLRIGSFLGTFIGSIALNLYNYQILIIALEALNIAAIVVIAVWAKESFAQ